MEKKVISNLTKCYSIAPLRYQGRDHMLVAAEKTDRCILFDLDGNEEETVWKEPGGVMTMVQVPGSDGQFLATHKFYSPNDSKEAKIVIVTPRGKDDWEVRTLVDLPFVHRFDILERGGIRYLIACALKSGHEYKEDWTMPGKVYVARLPENLSQFHEGNQLKLEALKDGMLKNHGYYRVDEGGIPTALISCEQGVFQFWPPENEGAKWRIEKLLDRACSDAVLLDMDGDGEKELTVLAPFHGDSISIYKKVNGRYEEAYSYGKPAEFAHAIWGGILEGKPSVVIGHRKGERNLLRFTYNGDSGSYDVQVLDSGCGAANAYVYQNRGRDVILATNREVDEVALYLFP